ncbi:hypothetical protein DAEQUDRAFT_34761 [Daedalea quercina L-15889]|uniref:Uncharacterized protein n=1 Tax=Daedalea quercina L-15889 TaxID=1314783 RepID=A0A165SS83_9APHY|nr:hypothetical protein DAEQUDRAFT_34761 [Daedalea quercina L-15889]
MRSEEASTSDFWKVSTMSLTTPAVLSTMSPTTAIVPSTAGLTHAYTRKASMTSGVMRLVPWKSSTLNVGGSMGSTPMRASAPPRKSSMGSMICDEKSSNSSWMRGMRSPRAGYIRLGAGGRLT